MNSVTHNFVLIKVDGFDELSFVLVTHAGRFLYQLCPKKVFTVIVLLVPMSCSSQYVLVLLYSWMGLWVQNGAIKTWRTCCKLLCKTKYRYFEISGVAKSIIRGGVGDHIHIFVFTDLQNNRLQKKLVMQNTNI